MNKRMVCMLDGGESGIVGQYCIDEFRDPTAVTEAELLENFNRNSVGVEWYMESPGCLGYRVIQSIFTCSPPRCVFQRWNMVQGLMHMYVLGRKYHMHWGRDVTRERMQRRTKQERWRQRLGWRDLDV